MRVHHLHAWPRRPLAFALALLAWLGLAVGGLSVAAPAVADCCLGMAMAADAPMPDHVMAALEHPTSPAVHHDGAAASMGDCPCAHAPAGLLAVPLAVVTRVAAVAQDWPAGSSDAPQPRPQRLLRPPLG